MRYNENREGLTFEEWVCAAGVAQFRQLSVEGFIPYFVSDKPAYPEWIRKAWEDGEDPTEHRTSTSSSV